MSLSQSSLGLLEFDPLRHFLWVVTKPIFLKAWTSTHLVYRSQFSKLALLYRVAPSWSSSVRHPRRPGVSHPTCFSLQSITSCLSKALPSAARGVRTQIPRSTFFAPTACRSQLHARVTRLCSYLLGHRNAFDGAAAGAGAAELWA